MSNKIYFLTGASGVIGSAIVPLLLKDPAISVRILLRSINEDDLAAKFQVLKVYWGAQDIPSSRLQALRGDVEQLNLGLSDSEAQRLKAECTHIIHAAGNVKMTLPLSQAQSAAFGAAKHLLAFASKCSKSSLEKVEFVSTVGVAGKTPGLIPETWLKDQPGFHNTYEQAKAEAELFVKQEIEKGLPITVHRPSMVVGDSQSGKIPHFQVFYHLCEFLTGKRTKGFMPSFGDASLDIIPSDYVAEAIVWSSQHPSTAGRIFHLASGPTHAIQLDHLKDTVQAYWRTKGDAVPKTVTLPIVVFRIGLSCLGYFATGKMKKALKTLPLFLDYLGEKQSFDNRMTQDLLASESIYVPAPDHYLNKLLDYYFLHRLSRGKEPHGKN